MGWDFKKVTFDIEVVCGEPCFGGVEGLVEDGLVTAGINGDFEVRGVVGIVAFLDGIFCAVCDSAGVGEIEIDIVRVKVHTIT